MTDGGLASLAGRVALVTGAARGLGFAHASLLARLGVCVVINDIGGDLHGENAVPSHAEFAAAQLRERGGRVLADASDVRTFAGASAAVKRTVDAFGRIDILINNAGTLHVAPLSDLEEADLLTDLHVHAVGTVATMRAAFVHMREQRFGRIVNTLSEAALRPELTTGIAYAAAKSAIWGATMSAALEGRPFGITVNAVSPGAMTRMSRPFLDEHGAPPGLDLSPDRVAEVTAGLCTDAAHDITGRVVHTSGGQVREFTISRVDGTDLVRRLRATAAEVRS